MKTIVFSRCADAIGGRRDDAPHFRDVALHAAESNKLTVRQFRDDAGERRFARARRAGENHRGQTIGFDGAAQKVFPGARMCSWPTNSSSERGRMRVASGAPLSAFQDRHPRFR